ncbi:MAG TPA: tetratricopeptide repeat protein [Humidesulfovibrio sp.]|uniref:tetratricopeptide repeat protein n=1 Tax=Humidesulfovibrio sp. TaxID=2910988 RepID=UPI002C67BA8A|nr:tetratricopeptide repeat protein [Humidesulfovibrio sp.]HWR04354.1 tetratricopeptide repeat protein [Humidesulfovibrio sp.]
MDLAYTAQRINGVFFQKVVSAIGTGTTSRRTEKYVYFFVQEREDETLELQTLGPDDALFGEKKTISRDELLENFLPEPQKSQEFLRRRAAEQQEIQKAVARGDKFYKRGETYSAEYEYGKALALDEENVRANFGIGLCYLARDEKDKARMVFERLVQMDAAFEDEHKHLFNEFGISLRKAGLFDEALEFYARGVALCPTDENLHHNMARAAFEKGDVTLASQHLSNCLKMNPEHQEARQFVGYLGRKHLGGF